MRTNGTTVYRALRRIYHFPRLAGKSLYRKLTKNSIFFSKDEIPLCSLFPRCTIDRALELYRPKSILDLGCGTGKSLDYFLDLEIEAVGVEGSQMAISYASHPEKIVCRDLNEALDLEREFDLIWCFEVVEHIHPKFLHHLMETFSRHSSCVVISAARPGQGGEGHFNEQSPEYWITKFNAVGYEWDQSGTFSLRQVGEQFSDNILAFRRK